jgi:hypothetical protein
VSEKKRFGQQVLARVKARIHKSKPWDEDLGGPTEPNVTEASGTLRPSE